LFANPPDSTYLKLKDEGVFIEFSLVVLDIDY
jgi:hypothetical protein